MPPSPVEELALLDLDRSNKGASKQRRDQINAEIAVMRDLLPLAETARQRLSQLQVMSLCCVYIRKCNVLQKLFRSPQAEKDLQLATCDFFQALTGFLLITTREGKLVYISENVTDYLGHSMVDMKTQGDSLYDIVDKRDHGAVQAQLLAGGAEPEAARDVAFFCRMNMSRTLKRQAGFGDVKVMHVRGHFIPLSDPEGAADATEPQPTSGGQGQGQGQQGQQSQGQRYVFMATCSPLITPELKENLVQSNTMVFKTVHQLDMSFLEVTKTAEYHLGFSTEEICQRSWYSMLHPEDIHEAREKHILLIRSSHEMGCMVTCRMLSADGRVLWVNVVMHVRQAATAHSDEPLIVCINQVISESEAYQIRMQSHMFTLYPPRTTDLWGAGGLGGPPQGGQLPLPLPHPHQHPMQPDAATRWMPPSPNTSTLAHASNYQAPKTSDGYYPGAQRLPPPCTTAYPAMHALQSSSSSLQATPIPAPAPLPLPALQAHTDNLKLMLKRKIQGPNCRPAKIPKLTWSDNGAGFGPHGQPEFNVATGYPMHSPDSVSQFLAGGSGMGDSYCWNRGSSVGVAPRAQYRVMPLAAVRQANVKAALRPLPFAWSPPLAAPTAPMASPDHVVPDSAAPQAVVPESFLTPDPSPATSPMPQSQVAQVAQVNVRVKTEPAVTLSQPPSSKAILHELEKLAALTGTHVAKAATPAPPVALPLAVIKQERGDSPPDCRLVPASAPAGPQAPRKDLPVMDAVDIDQFFDTLVSVISVSDLENLCEPNIEEGFIGNEKVENMTQPQSGNGVVSSESFVLPSMEIKTEPADLEDAQIAWLKKQQQTQQQQNAEMDGLKKPPQQEGLDANELEDLLGLFSDELSATQLDLTAALMTEEARTAPRPRQSLSPGSSFASDASGDEDDSLHALLSPRPLPPSPASSLAPSPPHGPAAHPHTPQDHEIGEEDELYQLDKLLMSMASSSGMMVCE